MSIKNLIVPMSFVKLTQKAYALLDLVYDLLTRLNPRGIIDFILDNVYNETVCNIM